MLAFFHVSIATFHFLCWEKREEKKEINKEHVFDK